jgi:hypothetical protein
MAMIGLNRDNQNPKNHGHIKEVPISSEEGVTKMANYKSKNIHRTSGCM